MKVERFVFTANNITYAVMGDDRGPEAVRRIYLDTHSS